MKKGIKIVLFIIGLIVLIGILFILSKNTGVLQSVISDVSSSSNSGGSVGLL